MSRTLLVYLMIEYWTVQLLLYLLEPFFLSLSHIIHLQTLLSLNKRCDKSGNAAMLVHQPRSNDVRFAATISSKPSPSNPFIAPNARNLNSTTLSCVAPSVPSPALHPTLWPPCSSVPAPPLLLFLFLTRQTLTKAAHNFETAESLQALMQQLFTQFFHYFVRLGIMPRRTCRRLRQLSYFVAQQSVL